MKQLNKFKTFKTILIQKDGASYQKNWIVKKKKLELYFDITTNKNWYYKKPLKKIIK